MQRSNVSPPISMLTSPNDNKLYNLQADLERVYWASKDGVWNFQFITDNQPLMNFKREVLYFNLVRYTPDVYYEAFATSVQGYITNHGEIVYGGGLKGSLQGENIKWENGDIWYPVIESFSNPKGDALDIKTVRQNAIRDSRVIGDIQYKYYYAVPYKN